MNCESCDHEFVCKYKKEYIWFREQSTNEYKGIFDVSCNEYKKMRSGDMEYDLHSKVMGTLKNDWI